MSDAYLDLCASVIPCKDNAPRHQIDRANGVCIGCGKFVHDLRCPIHQKVFSHNVDLSADGEYRRKWICRVCLSEGSDPFPDAREFQILLGRKMFAIGGGEVADSPQPDLRFEYPPRARNF